MTSTKYILANGACTLLPYDYTPHYSLIFLHGFAQRIQAFYQTFKHPLSPLHFGFKIILIQAPFRKIIAPKFQNAILPAWINSKQFNPYRHFQHCLDEDLLQQAAQSVNLLSQYIKTQIQFWRAKGIKNPEKNVFISGFSQGCSIILQYALQKDIILGGAIGLAGVLLKSNKCLYVDKTPIYICLGLGDELIPAQQFHKIYDRIKHVIKYEQMNLHIFEKSIKAPYNRHRMSAQTFLPFLSKTLKQLIGVQLQQKY